MMRHTLFVISILLFAAILSAPVLAGEITTIDNVVEVDGNIGIYIRNDVGLTMKTHSADYDTSVLTYTVDNVTVDSIPAKSSSTIKTEETKLVVLNHTWPKTSYSTIKLTFTDSANSTYAPETAYAFAKPGLTLVEARTDPEMATSDKAFTVYLKMKASGEGTVSDIKAIDLANPRYYRFQAQSLPVTSQKQGEVVEYSFTYQLSGQDMLDTINHQTVYAPIKFTYTYLDKNAKTVINESIGLYNKDKVKYLPKMKAFIDIPSTIIRGKTLDVPVYVWNYVDDTHTADTMNLTLEDASGELTIPITNILPSDKTFKPSGQPADPTTTFKMTVPESAPEGDYTLVLKGTFEDKEWSMPAGSFKVEKQFSVIKQTVINETPEAPAAPEEKIDEALEEDTEIVTPEKKAQRSKLTIYFVSGLILAGAVFLAVFILEKRGRYI